jgi:hypothetical protein
MREENKLIHKKFIKKIIICLTILSISTRNIINVFAVENENTINAKFKEATDETIIVYMEGYPIKKEDIDDNGIIKEEKINQINNLNQFNDFSQIDNQIKKIKNLQYKK